MDRLLRIAPAGASSEDNTQDSMILAKGSIVNIVAAEYLENYKLRLFFSNGRQRTVDFGKFLNRSVNPLIRRYLDLNEFKRFTVVHGDLIWNDYDLCFPIADLYEGRI